MVYIASPYTIGDVAVNVSASLDAANKLWDLGFVPFAPLLTHFWHFYSPKTYEEWMAMDKQYILRCNYVLRLPGESRGADTEIAFATENNIPVFYSIEALLQCHIFGLNE